MHNHFHEKIISFLVAILLSAFASLIFNSVNEIQYESHKIYINEEKSLQTIKECEGGCSECGYKDVGIEVYNRPQRIKRSDKCNTGQSYDLSILSKPRADYTPEARKANVSGTARLKVTFGANEQITSITPMNELPFGLTEQAIAAARKLEFEPETKCGNPVSVTKVIEYNFNLY